SGFACVAIKLGFDSLFRPACLVFLSRKVPKRLECPKPDSLSKKRFDNLMDSSWILRHKEWQFTGEDFSEIGITSVSSWCFRDSQKCMRFLAGTDQYYQRSITSRYGTLRAKFYWQLINDRLGYTFAVSIDPVSESTSR
ncbi:hypothetical protein CLAIMM_10643, partial [Cladophialophora immunda]